MNSPYGEASWNRNEGVALGTIALCQDCGFAIQLQRRRFKGLSGDVDVWWHFRTMITPHVGHPMRSWSDREWEGGSGRPDRMSP